MPDTEKVIKGLEELEGFLFKEYTNIKAEESKIYYDRFKSLSDALALLKEHNGLMLALEQSNAVNGFLNAEVERLNGLLKEQEAVKPIYIENPYTHLPVSYCPKCREPIDQYITGNPYRKTKYCHYCGKAVQWNERPV